jgi:hypothetical protein
MLYIRSMMLAVCMLLAACGAPPVPPSKLVMPAARCMVPPGKDEKLQPGDDLVVKYAALARVRKIEKSKIRCLQKWVRTVSKK